MTKKFIWDHNQDNYFQPEKENNFKLLSDDLYHGHWNVPNKGHDLHKKINYQLNNECYRSEDFDGTADLLTLGCSFTFGSGLPIEYSWPYLLGEKINCKVANLAQPGDSAQGQIRKAFMYFRKYGNPKVIVALLPLYRMEFPLVDKKLDIYRRKNESDLTNTWNFLDKDHDWGWDKNWAFNSEEDQEEFNTHKVKYFCLNPDFFHKYSKAPHVPDHTLPAEVAVFYTYNHIYMLEQYCKSNNIKLIWSLWEYQESIDNYLIKNKNEKLENYHQFNYIHENYKCHKEYELDELFYIAADRETGGGHWGIHQHLHLSEEYYDIIEESRR